MKRMGITRLANVTGLDHIGIPVFMAVRPNSRGVSVSQGKGVDIASAKVSALMESIEGWHAERVTVPLRYESYESLRRTDRCVDVHRLPKVHPRPVPPHQPLLWAEGYDLLQNARTWVPFESVTLSFVHPPGHVATFYTSSNGLASGNHMLEAICHGLCETLERDAIALWLHEEGDELAKQRQLDLATVDDPLCRSILERLAAESVRVALWDVTSDSGIPTYACGIFDKPQWRAKGLFLGYGTHLSPPVALLRAMTEAVQCRLAFIVGSRDDLPPAEYGTHASADTLLDLERQLQEPPPALDFRQRASLSTDTFEEDIATLLSALQRMGVESAVVVDLSLPEVGIPVVKMVVPGLEVEASHVVPGTRTQTQRKLRELPEVEAG